MVKKKREKKNKKLVKKSKIGTKEKKDPIAEMIKKETDITGL